MLTLFTAGRQNIEILKIRDGDRRLSDKKNEKSPVWLMVIILHFLFYLIKPHIL